MTDSKLPMPERRKNPARRKTVDVAYQIVWNAARRGFDVHRAGVATGGFGGDKAAAIALAIREAAADKAAGHKVVVYSTLDGSQNVEWSSN